ncbi:MAG: sulfatase-like hydrolase/transferase [bacterium]|nr:sulfatase-like hydrolase/transferase [bacterium]
MTESPLANKPNVVVVMCDQLRAFEVGCYGNPVVRTPNIDRLAAEGVRFEHAVSNNPVCMPARSCLLSGQYSRTCQGFLGNYSAQQADGTSTMPELPEDERRFLLDPTLPEQLRAVGYETTHIGKWHVQPAPPRVGFDYSLYPQVHHRHTAQTFIENTGPGELVDGFSIDYEAQAVADYLASVAGDGKPFFLSYHISPPHMPLDDAPEAYLHMYSPDQMPLRDNVWCADGSLPYDEHWFKIYLWDFLYYEQHLPFTQQLPPGFDLRHLLARYYGMVSWVDAQLGRLLAGLAVNGLAQDTIVVFLSDHGDNLGSHNLFNKGRLIEESIRIPMIWWWPSQFRHQVRHDEVASLIDVMPTVLDLAGGHSPACVQGHSLAAALRGNGNGPDHAFIETTGGEIGVRTPGHLFGLQLAADRQTVADEGGCFHDLVVDPYELTNLHGSTTLATVAAQLEGDLRDWHHETPIRTSHAREALTAA